MDITREWGCFQTVATRGWDEKKEVDVDVVITVEHAYWVEGMMTSVGDN